MEHLFPYWRERLAEWPCEVRYWRHDRNTTGWSMASQGFSFARFLFGEGEMTRQEFRRWFKFNCRVRRWSRK
jgi:hypothetical protein